MSHAIISSNKIISEDNGEILISINDLFLSETLRRVKPPKRPGSSSMSFSLGSLDKVNQKLRRLIIILKIQI